MTASGYYVLVEGLLPQGGTPDAPWAVRREHYPSLEAAMDAARLRSNVTGQDVEVWYVRAAEAPVPCVAAMTLRKAYLVYPVRTDFT